MGRGRAGLRRNGMTAQQNNRGIMHKFELSVECGCACGRPRGDYLEPDRRARLNQRGKMRGRGIIPFL